MIQQQKTGEPLMGAARRIASQYGILSLYRGLVCFLVVLLSHIKHHMLTLLEDTYQRLWLTGSCAVLCAEVVHEVSCNATSLEHLTVESIDKPL